MAGVLQAEVGAYVIGKPSLGNTETIYAYELTGGARLWLAQESFRLRTGINLEGLGIQPDVEVAAYAHKEEVLHADPAIQKALEYFAR